MKFHRRCSKTLLVAITVPLLFLSISFAQSRAARTAIKAGAATPTPKPAINREQNRLVRRSLRQDNRCRCAA